MEVRAFLICMLLGSFAFGVIPACGSKSEAPSAKAGSSAKEIEVPKTGTQAERTRKLWQTIRPLILADSRAQGLSNEDYWQRNRPIHQAWQTLQFDTAETSSFEVSRFITNVWMLMGDLYGAKGINPDYQRRVRERTKRKIEKKLKELDKMAASLK